MVYQSIYFVRGVVISDDDFRRLAESMPNVAKELKEMYQEQIENKDTVPDFSHKWWDRLYEQCQYYEIVCRVNRELEAEDVKVHNWPCCSELSGKQYIFGIVYASPEIDEIFNEEVSAPETPDPSVDDTIKRVVVKIGLDPDLPLRSIMLLDDCTFCS